MDNFERMGPSSFNSSIDSSTNMTIPSLPTLIVDFLADLGSSQVIYVGSTYFSKVQPALGLWKENVGTILEDD